MDFLNSGSYFFLGVFETVGRLPLRAGSDFDSSEVSVFLLEFQDQQDGVSLHVLLAKLDLGNRRYFFIGILV